MEKNYNLPDMTHTFKIQVKGRDSQINWAGEFVYKRPALGTRGRINVLRTRLNGDLETIDAETQILNEALAHLRYTLEKYPEWWSDTSFGFDLYDGNVISEIYNKCMDFEEQWTKRIHSGEPKTVEEKVDDAPPKEFDKAEAETTI